MVCGAQCVCAGGLSVCAMGQKAFPQERHRVRYKFGYSYICTLVAPETYHTRLLEMLCFRQYLHYLCLLQGFSFSEFLCLMQMVFQSLDLYNSLAESKVNPTSNGSVKQKV